MKQVKQNHRDYEVNIPLGPYKWELSVRIAGLGPDFLHFRTDFPWRCGQIIDGVSFRFDGDAGGVMSFADLERVYLAIKAAQPPPPPDA